MVAWPSNCESFLPSVLIADDNAGWRDIVGDILSRAGFRALEAADGEEAVEVVRAERLDIVLLDFHMPRLDGLAALKIIRREEIWIPAVMITSNPDELPRDQVRELRVHTVLAKTVDRHVIVATVTRLVRRN